jgi:hypothetical protein
MRKILDAVVLFLILAGAGYFAYTHQSQVRGLVREVHSTISPCITPLTYSIGTVDPRFNIPKSALITDLKDAEGIWETASGKNLFEYVPSGGDVTVNLVYDSRQASTDKLAAAGIQVDQSVASYDALKARYDSLVTSVASERSAYDAKVSGYKADEAAYNAEVERANARGGATPAEFAQLQADKTALEQEFAGVKSLETAMNADIDTVNALATAINQLIVQLNLNVAQYNSEGTAAGAFEEGLYQLSGGVQTIDIYEYSNHVQLVRVLAHEMGHALGLEHVADSNAIMYKINNGTTLKATAADITELDRACRIGT